MDVIRMNIRMKLLEHGYHDISIDYGAFPCMDYRLDERKGEGKAAAIRIAPPLPLQQVCHPAWFQREEAIECPHCHSYHTTLISEFGSTACKAHYRCEDCKEPFDYFKCH